MLLRNHPSHDLDCCLDRAALLTQEGSPAGINTPSILQCLKLMPILGSTNLAKPNLDSCSWEGGGQLRPTNKYHATEDRAQRGRSLDQADLPRRADYWR